MYKAIVIHQIKERVWRSAGITILPGHHDKKSSALLAAKASARKSGGFFRDKADIYDVESLTPKYFK